MKIDENQIIEVEEKKEKKKVGRPRKVKDSDSGEKIKEKVSTVKEKVVNSEKFNNIREVKPNDNKFKYAIVFLLGFVIAFAGFYCFNDYLVSRNGTSVKITEEELSSGINNIYDAVVYIENYENNKVTSSGTGFIYKKANGKGYIVTNQHVVTDSKSLKVTMADGKKVSAKYLGGDEYLDIACLEIDDKYVTRIAKFGKSSNLSLGSTLFTVGTPVGDQFRGTVTRGILSGKDRFVSVSVSGGMEDYVMKVIQTDAAMNPGNSGGPLCDANGEVIGINSLKLVKNEIEGMGFAISIEDVEGHLASFEKGKAIERPYLGVSIFNLDGKNSLKQYKLDDKVKTDLDKGIVVKDVEKGASAYGKLLPGDIVVKVNEVSVDTIAYFRYELFKNEVGDNVTITVERNGKLKNVVLLLKGKNDSKSSKTDK